MRPGYGRRRSNEQIVREKTQFPCFSGSQHQPVRSERDRVTVSVGCGVNDVEAGQNRGPVWFEEEGRRGP
jgi:hypothetical protein